MTDSAELMVRYGTQLVLAGTATGSPLIVNGLDGYTVIRLDEKRAERQRRQPEQTDARPSRPSP